MKRLLIKIAIFLSIIIFLAYGLDYMISTGLSKTQRGHFFMTNTLMHDTINADIIILGNSRAGGYNPQVIDSIFGTNTWNLWLSGQHFGVEYLRYQLYKRHNDKPKLVLLNIGMAELGYVEYGLEREHYYPYVHEPFLKPYLEAYGYSWLDFNCPMYRYRGDYKIISIGLLEFLGVYHDMKGNHIRGYVENPNSFDRTAFEQRKLGGVIKDMHDTVAICLLDTFLNELRVDDIPIVFIHAPMYYELNDWLDLDSTMLTYDRLSKKYHIPCLDYSNIDMCQDSIYFKDTNHLNALGADRFSARLAYDIDSIGILK